MINTDLIKVSEDRVKEFKELQKAGLICLDGEFFPSVHYPPITMYPPIQEGLFEGYENPADNKFVIYAHLPFCKQRCTFCHYPNIFGDQPKERDYYLKMIEKEMNIYINRLGLEKIKARSILIGGGTPTYMPPEQLIEFLEFFTKRLDLTECTQFNYDVDPQTLLGPDGHERLKIMKSYGVDRLTIGVQSLNNEILKRMNRHHTAEEAIESIHKAKEFGFQLNIEFIFGYPGQTHDIWVKDIEKAVTLDVEEIQLYRLKIIPYGDLVGSITKKYTKNQEEFISIEDALRMKQQAILILAQHGYHENLRRVFTKERKFFSHYAHDQCCNLFDQIGLGLTAFSSLRDRFGLNTQYFEEYYELINSGKLPLNRGLIRKRDDQLRWHIILPLKNRNVFKKIYEKRTGVSLNYVFRKKIDKLKKFNLIYEDEKVLQLTPLGSFFADEVCLHFYHPDYMPFPKKAYTDDELNPYNDNMPD